MKPSTPISTPKSTSLSSSSSGSTSKSKSPNKVKKSDSGSKSKSKKSSGSHSPSSSTSNTSKQPLTVQANLGHLNSTEHASPNSCSRDKSQKIYVGISAKSVKCYWEQHENGETEVHPDVLPILAEDASYRLWELANNLKTFTRHSGGKLTTDIVNEVLKDCDVPPVIGARAGKSEWNQINYDGIYYYHADEIIDLRDEYLKEISAIQCGPLVLESNWVTNQRNQKDLTKLWQSIILAIVAGDDIAFQYTIHTTLINPFIGCMLPYLIQKTIEYLSFGCSEDTLDRLLRFLRVIIQNYHCRDVLNNEQYFNLANLFVCLLLGPIDMKHKSELIKLEITRKECKRSEMQKRVKEEHDKAAIKTELDSTSKLLKTEFGAAPNTIFPYLDNSGIAVNIKKEGPDEVKPHSMPFEQNIKFEPNFYDMDSQDDVLNGMESADCGPTMYPNFDQMNDRAEWLGNEFFSQFETEKCDDRYVENLCSLMGHMSAKWGYFEHELIYLMTKRLEIFFYETKSWSRTEFKWLERVVQAVSALGNFAFRELTIYFDRIPYKEMPEWLATQFNYGAIYIAGQKDIYFYEFMQEICGDSLIPFLTHYSKFVHQFVLNTLTANKSSNHKPFKIATKISLKCTQRFKVKTETDRRIGLDEIFPHRVPTIKIASPITRKIGFKFAGCCPVLAKPKNKLSTEQHFLQSAELLALFSRKIVICRRKLLKTLYINDLPKITHLANDHRGINL